MTSKHYDSAISEIAAGAEDVVAVDVFTKVRREKALLKTGALQDAIFNSANFSSIATDEKGVIQLFNVGAERMLGYTALEVVDKITPADISDPQEVIARAKALSAELATPMTPGFEALVFKASRGIEDIYELTYIRKDGSRFPAVVSVTALRDAQGGIIGYLLVGTDNTARKQVEAGAHQRNPRSGANRVRKTGPVQGTDVARRSPARMPGDDRTAGATARHQNDLSQVRRPSVRRCRSDPVEAGAHQPAFERDQVQPDQRIGSRGMRQERSGTDADQRPGHRRGPASGNAAATLPAVQPPGTGARLGRKARASVWS